MGQTTLLASFIFGAGSDHGEDGGGLTASERDTDEIGTIC